MKIGTHFDRIESKVHLQENFHPKNLSRSAWTQKSLTGAQDRAQMQKIEYRERLRGTLSEWSNEMCEVLLFEIRECVDNTFGLG